MEDESKEPSPDYSVIRHLLSALFTMVDAERKKKEQDQSQLRNNFV